MNIWNKIKKMFTKEKTITSQIDPRFEEQKFWFINNLPKTISCRADESYCADFINSISDHFDPIELENFSLKLSIEESTFLGKRLAALMQEYINYRKHNAILLKDFFKETEGRLSKKTIQIISTFLKNDDEYGEKIFEMYNRLSHLLILGAEINKAKEKK